MRTTGSCGGRWGIAKIIVVLGVGGRQVANKKTIEKITIFILIGMVWIYAIAEAIAVRIWRLVT